MLDFPSAPTNGQKFPQPPVAGLPTYTWDGEKWTTIGGNSGGGGSSVYISAAPPTGVADNALWWESDTGVLYVRYNDGNSTAWVQASPTVPAGPQGPQGIQGPQGVQGPAGTSVVIPGNIYGLTLSTNGSQGFVVQPGVAADLFNAVTLALPAQISKTTAAWAVGSNAGALDTGTIAASTWYHVYLIRRPDTGVVDVAITLGVAPNLPANYTQYRRIGSMLTNASSQWTLFSQIGDDFLWTTPPQDVQDSTLGTTAKLYVLSVPTGLQVLARIRGQYLSTTLANAGLLTSPDEVVQVANTPLGNNSVRNFSTSTANPWGDLTIRTNTSAQIRAVAQGSSTLYLMTFGWIDRRGKDG